MAARILVVDDEQGLRDILYDLLDFEGYEVVACADAESARRELASQSFGVAMLDVYLSGLPEGLELAGDILADYPKTGIVIMTGFADRNDVDRMCGAGAFTCIDKPFNLDEVVSVVEKVLSTTQAASGQ